MSSPNAEAHERLRQSVIAHAKRLDLIGPGEILTDFLVVAAWLDSSEDGETRYTSQTGRDHMPPHIELGLLTIGGEMVGDDCP